MSDHNKIAMFFDADKTLLPEYMPDTLVKYFGGDVPGFWSEVGRLEARLKDEGRNYQNEALYTQVILKKAKRRDDCLYRLTRDELEAAGSSMALFPGLPEFFPKMRDVISSNPEYRAHGISVDFYIVSSGLADMLRGSPLTGVIDKDKMFGIEFDTDRNGVVSGLVHFMSYTEKTKFLYMVKKGVDIEDINSKVEDSVVPFANMVYAGDGPTDVPCFSIVGHNGGITFAVYSPDDSNSFENSFWLRTTHRATFSCVADYREGSDLFRKMGRSLRMIADRIVEGSSRKKGFAPSH